MDHPCQVWFNLVQGLQRRRFKCESLRRTDGQRRTTSDGQSSPGELKITTGMGARQQSLNRSHVPPYHVFGSN